MYTHCLLITCTVQPYLFSYIWHAISLPMWWTRAVSPFLHSTSLSYLLRKPWWPPLSIQSPFHPRRCFFYRKDLCREYGTYKFHWNIYVHWFKCINIIDWLFVVLHCKNICPYGDATPASEELHLNYKHMIPFAVSS